jgi:Spy/CpxP family protein refolding chaperone
VKASFDLSQDAFPARVNNELIPTKGTDMKALRIGAIALGLAAAGAATAQGYGYGPGSGYGPGGGMMGGYGGGMMGYGSLSALDLKDDQRDKIFAIQEEARSKNFGTMTQMRAEQYKVAKMYHAEKADPKAVAEQQKKVDDLRRQMIQSHVETRNQIEAVLTPEQKKQLRHYGPWWMQGTE